MPIPVRTKPSDYHYHVYDYDNARPWELSPRFPLRDYQQFYSMLKDLWALFDAAVTSRIPHATLTVLPAQIAADGSTSEIQVLSLGGSRLDAPSQVVITGGIHAREWIGTEIAYLVAEYLVKNYTSAPTNPYEDAIWQLLSKRRIHFIPMVNPAGNRHSVTSDRPDSWTWRPNRRRLPTTAAAWRTDLTIPASGLPQVPFRNVQQANGVTSYEVPRYLSNPRQYDAIDLPNTQVIGVDINRNCSTTYFGYSGGPNYQNGVPANEGQSYFGTSTASELETRNIEDFLDHADVTRRIRTSIDYHSYGKFILYPSEQSHANAIDADYVSLGEVMQRLIMPSLAWPFGYNYELGTPLQLVHYDATGTIADRISQVNQSRSFTIELDPGGNHRLEGFKLPPDEIMSVFEKNIRGALALMAAGGQPTTVTNDKSFGLFDRRTINSAERIFLDWNVYGRGNQLPLWQPPT